MQRNSRLNSMQSNKRALSGYQQTLFRCRSPWHSLIQFPDCRFLKRLVCSVRKLSWKSRVCSNCSLVCTPADILFCRKEIIFSNCLCGFNWTKSSDYWICWRIQMPAGKSVSQVLQVLQFKCFCFKHCSEKRTLREFLHLQSVFKCLISFLPQSIFSRWAFSNW